MSKEHRAHAPIELAEDAKVGVLLHVRLLVIQLHLKKVNPSWKTDKRIWHMDEAMEKFLEWQKLHFFVQKIPRKSTLREKYASNVRGDNRSG